METEIDAKVQDSMSQTLNLSRVAQPGAASTKSNQAEETEEEDVEYYGIGYDHIENVQLYNKGGHHPVHLGDILNDRYEVVHKLGSGGFGLVWLCQDIVTKKWRAVKIMTAEHSEQSNEEKVYKHLLERSSLKELEENHLLIPLERFWIEGPNGRHYCLVLPVLGPTVSSWRVDVSACNHGEMTEDVRKVCTHIVQAVRYLHQSGVCHGDLKPENVMMEVRGLDGLSKAEVLELLGEPETCEVETESGKPPAPRGPEYIVLPPWDPWWEGITTSSPAIIDFGASYLTSDPPEAHGMSLAYAAPEVIWGSTFPPGPHSDIWSLAATLYRVVWHGAPLFSGEHINSTVRDFEFFLGGLPEPYRSIHFAEWCAANAKQSPGLERQEERDRTQSIDESRWERLPVKWKYERLIERRAKLAEETGYSDPFEASLGTERQFLPNIIKKGDLTYEERHKAIKWKLPREDILGLSDLLRNMVRYDPAKRITIDEVARHTWLGDSPECSTLTDGIKGPKSPTTPVGVVSTVLVMVAAYAIQSRYS
ncbi:hypothetical protein EKO27_g631 [Xylaria grammica]|uniref:non-specific serine/threonine protein kinase n=1 Tax=Xylaria grammica TaxID=363999 RepID=A0A439DJ67_9PEZI|nr:hypothetical protein EKO27_g631 [Xylaria grammica]